MKIIHTSDWHLGKRLEGKSRIAEQREVLNELVLVCEKQNIDVVIIAGDIFDSVNPPSEAEELFYSSLVRLASNRVVIAIAGNHDNAERLSAPSDLAKACNIVLGGGMDYSAFTRKLSFWEGGEVKGGEGYASIFKGDERVNFALLAYPSLSRMSGLGYLPSSEVYSDNVREWFKLCVKTFDSGVNIAVSHLFMSNSARSDELELGAAALLPLSVLPECDYVALGHVHKPQKVSSSKNVYYSGSLLNYSFDEVGDRFFNIIDTSDCLKVVKHKIQAGRKTLKFEAKSFMEAILALEDNADSYVQIRYNCAQPLTASNMNELRAHENFCAVVNIFRAEAQIKEVKRRSDSELFVDFFKAERGEQPSQALIDLFLRALNGEEL